MVPVITGTPPDVMLNVAVNHAGPYQPPPPLITDTPKLPLSMKLPGYGPVAVPETLKVPVTGFHVPVPLSCSPVIMSGVAADADAASVTNNAIAANARIKADR